MNAIAYLRVSGKSQVEGDGFPRQQQAIESAATRLGYTITHTFRDEGVSGTKPWNERPSFMDMIAFLCDNPDTKVIIVENLTRLAREFVVQDGILLFLASKGIDLFSADTMENVTEAVRTDPMKKALIQMQAVFSELEKSNLVIKLRKARERKKAAGGITEGRKPFGHRPGEANTLDYMIRLRRQSRSLQSIADELNESAIHRSRTGRPWTAATLSSMFNRLNVQPDNPDTPIHHHHHHPTTFCS